MILTFNLSQVLQRCHVVLQEIPAGLRQKRQQSIADSLHHMTACITYSMAKVRQYDKIGSKLSLGCLVC